jgi:hypothetical protein
MLDPNVNGFLLWTISQYVQDQEVEYGQTRAQALDRVAATGVKSGNFTREDVDLACALYPGREMPDEGIFPIPDDDHRKIQDLDLMLDGG